MGKRRTNRPASPARPVRYRQCAASGPRPRRRLTPLDRWESQPRATRAAATRPGVTEETLRWIARWPAAPSVPRTPAAPRSLAPLDVCFALRDIVQRRLRGWRSDRLHAHHLATLARLPARHDSRTADDARDR